MSELKQDVVIIGAGHAGGTAAVLLRQYGHTGRITLLGDEALPPYQRPPLSKKWLLGEADEEDLVLKSIEFYNEHTITFRANSQVVHIDRVAKAVTLANGIALTYDVLIVATGSRNVSLPVPGATLSGVFSLRTAHDAEQIKQAIGAGKRLAVIGGGYIGLEIAACGRGLGADVTVIEREERLLARVACGELGNFFRSYHEEHGVRFELGCTIREIVGDGGQVSGVAFSDGRILSCDVAIVGIGARPNEELGMDAGLSCARGIVVDLEARTSDPSIFAIGDVTHRPLPLYGRMHRLESVPNALEQAKQAVCAITGKPAPPVEVPWQWSDQYDIKLQIAGYPFDADTTLLRGQPSVSGFAVFHLKGDLVQAVEAINSPTAFMIGKQLIGRRTRIDRKRLKDEAVSLKEVAA